MEEGQYLLLLMTFVSKRIDKISSQLEHLISIIQYND